MRRTLARIAVALAITTPWAPGFALTVPANLWIQQPAPTLDLPPERAAGVYQGRGWNHMRYDAVAGKMVLFDGYAELPLYTFDSIFANALWFYDPIENRLSLEKVDNWTTENGLCQPLPENTTDPTPYDRHFYSCFIYSPSKNAAYLWAGANRTIEGNSIGDTWTYDFASHAWREIKAPHPYTVYEQACAYDPDLETMILFAGTDREYGTGEKTYTLDLNTETWTDQAPAFAPSPRMGQNMVFDPARHVTWMFAGAPFGSADSELWTYDAAANQWAQIPKQDPWPSARRFAHFARDSRHDVILMWGGVTATDQVLSDTWAFHPATQTWEPLFPAESPSVPGRYYSVDLDYDPVNDFFVLNLSGVFWLYRYTDLVSDTTVSGPAGAGLSLRIASLNPASDGAALTFFLPRASGVNVAIFDAAGHRVDTVATGTFGAGPHTIRWTGRAANEPAPSGIYFARFESSGHAVTRKFTLLR